MGDSERNILRAISAYIPQFIVAERVREPGLPSVRGQFRRGTLVFADVSGFTAMSEKLSELGREGAEELTSILNRYFTQMLSIAFSYGGAQLKFGGDAMLLLFMGHRHAARAVRCALSMQEAMRHFRQVSTSRGRFRLEMSIGVNTCEFFEASVGPPNERLHCVFTGREVNRIAQIEAVANAGEVFVGAGTVADLGDRVEMGEEREGHSRVVGLRSRVRRSAPFELEVPEESLEGAIQTLSLHLPRQLREKLRANPELAAFEGEHRRVTVMFVNVLGSSEIVEQYGKARVADITRALNDYFVMVEATVSKYEGLVVGCDLNTRGDKLLIIFGAPLAHEDDDERAVLCALEMRQRLAESGLPLRQRVGVNSGYVFCGEVGSPARKEYTVMGDHVNLAARMMGVAQEGQVLIGQSTHSRVAGRFVLEAQEPVKVKGKRAPVTVYRVEGVQGERAGLRQPAAGELIGRDKEVAALTEVLERALGGQGQVVGLTGPAGIGKSRLAQEVRLRWAERSGQSYAGTCQSYGAHTPFLPWTDLLSAFFDLREGDDAKLRAHKIETTVADLCPELGEWTAVFGSLLHAPIPESGLLQSLDAELRHQRLLDVILELLQAQAMRGPLLLLFRNLQWADAASVELLNYVARNIREYPVLICLLYRPEDGLGLQLEGRDNYTGVALGELPADSTLDLVRSMAHMAELPAEFGQMVVARSQGNPLFVEEVVRSLMGSGHLVADASTGEYQLARGFRALEVPETVEGVIMARLDQLADEARNVLRVASVIGRGFQDAVLRDIYPRPIPDEELRQRLDDLTGLGLLRPATGKAVPEHYFQHILTQEVAYGSLLFAQRRELHHKVGQYFERHHPDELDQFYELLFYHYDRTRDVGKALEYAVRAGDKAKGMFANQDAIGYYQRALELTGGVPESAIAVKARVQEDLGDIYELTSQYDQALESYRGCELCYEELDRKARRRRKKAATAPETLQWCLPSVKDGAEKVPALCRKSGVVYERKGQYDVALECLDRGLGLLAEDCAEKARLWVARTAALYRKGEHTEALAWCQRALDMAQGVGDLNNAAHSYYLLGAIHTDLGNISQAIEYRRRSLSIYEETANLPGQARVHNNLGVDYYYQGDWQKAREHYQQSLEIRKRIGDVSGVAVVANNLGEVLSDQGYLDEAIEAFLTCRKTWERTGYYLGVGLSHSNLGRACVRLGEWEKGLEHLERGRQIFEEIQSKGFLTEVYQRFAEAYLGLAQPGTALEYCERSLALARQRGMTVVEGVTSRIKGQVYRSLGKWHEAEGLLRDSERILRDAGVLYELGQTLWQRAALLQDMGEAEPGSGAHAGIRQCLEESIAIFDKLGVKYDAARAAALGGGTEVGH